MAVDYFCFSQVDDGTAVIDCNHPHPQPTLPKVDAKRSLTELSKPDPPSVLKPVAKVGNFVRVVGKVRAVYNSLRQIIVDRIGLFMNITFLAPTDGTSIGRDMQFSK
jgi:hypothetical protein